MKSRTPRILIVGGGGMLGKTLLKTCMEHALFTRAAGKEEIDITDRGAVEKILKDEGYTYIVNCAAYTDVDRAEREYEKALRVNAEGAENLAKAALSTGARLLHVSTDYVFDGTSKEACAEEKACNPVNAYGRSKWEGEKRIQAVNPDACILRTSWLFGEGGKNFLSSLLNGLKSKETMRIVDDQWGRATYVRDLADAILSLLDEKGLFHFANQGATSRYEMAKWAFDYLQAKRAVLTCQSIFPVTKEVFPLPALRPTHSILCTEKYMRATGKTPRHWTEALQEFLEGVQ